MSAPVLKELFVFFQWEFEHLNLIFTGILSLMLVAERV